MTDTREDWEALTERSKAQYKPDVQIVSVTADKRVETAKLLDRLQAITVDIAFIGTGKKQARARVHRSGSTGAPMFDTGECGTKSMEDRLGKYMAQLVHIEAMRIAG